MKRIFNNRIRSRRQFLRESAAAGIAVGSSGFLAAAAPDKVQPKSASNGRRLHPSVGKTFEDCRPVRDAISKSAINDLAKPNKYQLGYMDMEMGLFLHYGMNTYTGEGTGGKGEGSPELFNPGSIDYESWAETARIIGAKFGVLTARHEEGFCLWPTKTTDYSVASSPYKNGKGDVVGEYAEAFRSAGLQVGLYHASFHDSHHMFQPGDDTTWYKGWFRSMAKRMSDPKAYKQFKEMQLEQIRELFTNYGEICYIYLDHINERHDIIPKDISDDFWTAIVNQIRLLQPNCILLQIDSDFIGGHGARAPYPLHYHREGASFFTAKETNAPLSGGWFYRGNQTNCSAQDAMDMYYRTVGHGAVFIPNYAPDKQGQMPKAVFEHAHGWGDQIRKIFDEPVAETKGTGNELVLKFPKPSLIDHVVLMEDLKQGQKVEAFDIYFMNDSGDWERLFRGKTIGHKIIEKAPPTKTDALRFVCTQSNAGDAAIRRFGTYYSQ